MNVLCPVPQIWCSYVDKTVRTSADKLPHLKKAGKIGRIINNVVVGFLLKLDTRMHYGSAEAAGSLKSTSGQFQYGGWPPNL